jgi:uncharacterized protein (DUF58 family)
MLDPAVLASIGDLEVVARVTVEGTISGLHRSPFHGYSAEFSQYRHYRPGDDLKYVDWKLFARTDRIYTKQYRETTNLLAELAVDASASMGFRGQTGIAKFEYARLLAAAISYLIAAQGDGVGLVLFDESVRQFLPSRSGQVHLRSLWSALTRATPSGGTASAGALRRAAELLKRPGLLIVFSDLYDDGEDVEAELRRAVGMGHEVVVFHILTRDEIEFPVHGAVELADLESGRTVFADGSLRSHYLARMGKFVDGWQERCARHGIDYTRVLTDAPLDRALRGYLARRHGASAR